MCVRVCVTRFLRFLIDTYWLCVCLCDSVYLYIYECVFNYECSLVYGNVYMGHVCNFLCANEHCLVCV